MTSFNRGGKCVGPTIVIDGQNVAFAGANLLNSRTACKPSIAALLATVDFFIRGMNLVDTVAFIPDYWVRSKPTDDAVMRAASSRRGTWDLDACEREALRNHILAGSVVAVPAKDADDPYILAYAWAKHGFIVSNDRFRDHAAKILVDAADADRTSAEAAASSFLMEEDGEPVGSHMQSVSDKLEWLGTHVISFALRPIGLGTADPASVAWEFIPNPKVMQCLAMACSSLEAEDLRRGAFFSGFSASSNAHAGGHLIGGNKGSEAVAGMGMDLEDSDSATAKLRLCAVPAAPAPSLFDFASPASASAPETVARPPAQAFSDCLPWDAGSVELTAAAAQAAAPRALRSATASERPPPATLADLLPPGARSW